MASVRASVAVLSLFVTSTLASTITAKAAMPSLLRRQNIPQCSVFASIESSCSLATPSLSALDFTSQAKCLCYQTGSFAPTVFDNGWNSCLSYFKTASPSYYTTSIGTNVPTAPCAINAAQITAASSVSSVPSSALSSAASVASSSASSVASAASTAASGTITSAATVTSDVYRNACTSWEAIQNACSSATPGFSGLPFSDEASCLCYVGTRWSPLIYDGYWSSCLHFVQTANATLYSLLQSEGVALSTPCEAAGNVRQTITTSLGMSSSSSSSSSSRSTTSSSSATVRTTTSAAPTSSAAGIALSGATTGLLASFLGVLAAALAL